jgi:hypothetical protein
MLLLTPHSLKPGNLLTRQPIPLVFLVLVRLNSR